MRKHAQSGDAREILSKLPHDVIDRRTFRARPESDDEAAGIAQAHSAGSANARHVILHPWIRPDNRGGLLLEFDHAVQRDSLLGLGRNDELPVFLRPFKLPGCFDRAGLRAFVQLAGGLVRVGLADRVFQLVKPDPAHSELAGIDLNANGKLLRAVDIDLGDPGHR